MSTLENNHEHSFGSEPPDPNDLFTVEEAAYKLRIGRTTVYTLLNSGSLRSITIMGRRLIQCAEIERFIAARARASRPPESRA